MNDRDRFPTIKEEARGNIARITPIGQELNAQTMRLFVEPGLAKLAAEGNEADTRCGTCAGRPGTVPAGCLQTQADFLKAIHEDVPFMCHAHQEGGQHTRLCHAWFAARTTMEPGHKIPAPWPWSHDADRLRSEEASDA